ncbi:MAG: tyrosine recombinase XerC [Clostridia bacterium]|nr:tyrosine recombinase XerC [Clostridia bacterium]
MTNYKPDYEAFPPLLCDYLLYIETVKNRAVKTVFEYSINLREFLSFLVVEKKICKPDNIDIRICDENFFNNVSLSDAYQYLSYCKNEKNNSAATRSRKVIAIRQFFKYLTDNRRILADNPMRALDTPKKEKTLPKYLTLEQSMNLLSSVDGKNKERDYAILTIFLNCGLRLSELVSLNYTDIRSDNSMRVLGKGSKERIVYLNDACVSAIEAYMRVRPKDGVIDKRALFLSNRLRRISTRTVQHIVDTFLEKSGLANMGLSTHKLRHTAATLMYQYGNVDVLVLKDVLGHENLSTTEIYTHLADTQKKDAIESNPLSSIKPTKK